MSRISSLIASMQKIMLTILTFHKSQSKCVTVHAHLLKVCPQIVWIPLCYSKSVSKCRWGSMGVAVNRGLRCCAACDMCLVSLHVCYLLLLMLFQLDSDDSRYSVRWFIYRCIMFSLIRTVICRLLTMPHYPDRQPASARRRHYAGDCRHRRQR